MLKVHVQVTERDKLPCIFRRGFKVLRWLGSKIGSEIIITNAFPVKLQCFINTCYFKMCCILLSTVHVHASVCNNIHPKWSLLLKERICSSWSKFFPVKVDPYWERRPKGKQQAFPEVYQVTLLNISICRRLP